MVDQKDNDGFQDITKTFVKFDNSGDTVRGIYRGSDIVEIGGQPTVRHFLETTEGDVAFLGGSQLDATLTKELMGVEVKIEFTGTAKTNAGREVKQFRIGKKEKVS